MGLFFHDLICDKPLKSVNIESQLGVGVPTGVVADLHTPRLA